MLSGLASPRDVDQPLLDEVDASLVGVAVHHALDEGSLALLEGLDGLLVVRLVRVRVGVRVGVRVRVKG